MNKIDMTNLGLNKRFITESTLYKELYIGRVISEYKNLYKVVTEDGELTAEISGKLRFKVKNVSDYPAVGDFVMIDRTEDISGNAIIHTILTRKSAFIRKAAGTSNDNQIVASNIDTVFICMSLNNDFNIRRIERYLGIAWDSGAKPVIVLTKSDLCKDLSEKLTEIDTVAMGVDVIVTSSMSEDGYLPIKSYLGSGKTIAFIGSSGVGKSTLINKVIGENILETNGIRNDDKGRHTTTRREMIVIPNGGVVIDTPGMREIGIESVDLSKTFTDIDELSAKCKFSDCTHSNEPKCAVQEAIRAGLLSKDRLESYLKLKKEAKYEGLNSRQIENEKLNEIFKEFGGMKSARKMLKEKSKSR
ncbi:MAG TPA: ribosome small subunit-dependent GTPase A [Clostridiales bacterium]|uniref:ribosome small subunit-dependent GTPase A n=1 Tax=Clostridiisalibacter paucivorans TaxID=408753 RepID=UPI000479AF86|nr:ribosome small subunit-dependent GTPase A [Clostridiisalibacter paucivorans]HAQ40601.1 ribosome small subunit-dependent GTPase A [Clostridiales bacterium]